MVVLIDFEGEGETATVSTAGSVSDTCDASAPLGGGSVLVVLSGVEGLLFEDDGTGVRGYVLDECPPVDPPACTPAGAPIAACWIAEGKTNADETPRPTTAAAAAPARAVR